ncbi:hypothetical protein [Actinoplanes sp. M2I2]|uniref:hypothetical protein n=1 Tax=Actinoplanes sp. M2I2 TaxID=1734444 RepID=UPI002020D77F|nr:hypothetical protein [Actinoplanes sp. M2I2]
MASASYSRAVTVATLNTAFTSAWIAARELPPAKRRLVRLGLVAVGAAGYAAAAPDARRAFREIRSEVDALRDKPADSPEPAAADSDGSGEPATADADPAKPIAEFTLDKRQTAALVGVMGVTIAMTFGRHQLEKRWLARLTRDGHPHPTRALALRMAPMAFAAEMVSQLIDMHTPGKKR